MTKILDETARAAIVAALLSAATQFKKLAADITQEGGGDAMSRLANHFGQQAQYNTKLADQIEQADSLHMVGE